MNGRCAFAVQFIVIRMKIETAQPAVQCCADVHFFFVIRTGVNAFAHMVFSKERFMTKCKAIEVNEPKSSLKNHNSTQRMEKNMTHKEKSWGCM
jgi:hypothetical protein